MRIYGRDAVLQAYVHKVGGNRARALNGPGGPPANEDVLTLSQLAQDVQKVKDRLATLPEVREDRVADVRGRLDRGEYHVSDEELADAILASGALSLPEGRAV